MRAMMFDKKGFPLTAEQREYYDKVFQEAMENKEDPKHRRQFWLYWDSIFTAHDLGIIYPKPQRLAKWEYHTRETDIEWEKHCDYIAAAKTAKKFNIKNPFDEPEFTTDAYHMDRDKIWYGSGCTEWEYREKHNAFKGEL